MFCVTDPPVGLECSSSCSQQISSLEFLLPFVCQGATQQPTNCRLKLFTFHSAFQHFMNAPANSKQEAGDDVTQRHQDETILCNGYALATTWMGVGSQITYNCEGFSHYLVNKTSNTSGWFFGSSPGRGQNLYWQQRKVQRHLQSVAVEQGIEPSNCSDWAL